MKNILVIGAGACGFATTRLFAQASQDNIVIVSPQSEKEEKQSQFDTEPIPYVIKKIDLPMNEYFPTRKEIESYHPFKKFIGKPRGKKGRW